MKAIIIAFGFTSTYSLIAGLTAESIAAGFGITDPSLYQEFEESDFDAACYELPQFFSLKNGVVSYDQAAADALRAVAATSTAKELNTTMEAV